MRLYAEDKVKAEIKEISEWLATNTRAPEQIFIDKARRRNDLVARLEIKKPRKVTSTVGEEYVIKKG